MTEQIDTNRRGFMKAGAAALALSGLGASGAAAQTTPSSSAASATGRRMLGELEVSELGLGVQNVARTFHTTIPTGLRCTTSSEPRSIGA